MKLLGRVVVLLERSEIPHCLIGAAAMAAHGVPRSTLDLDLLTTDRRVLDESLWAPLRDGETAVQVRRGDAKDPLAGVVRVSAPELRAVDLIVGRFSWQADIVTRASPISVQGVEISVAEPADLILLKLYAGGPQDRWDIQQILAVSPSDDLEALLDERLARLPGECSEFWKSLHGS